VPCAAGLDAPEVSRRCTGRAPFTSAHTPQPLASRMVLRSSDYCPLESSYEVTKVVRDGMIIPGHEGGCVCEQSLCVPLGACKDRLGVGRAQLGLIVWSVQLRAS
jgi:hypothetical protein